MLFGVFFRVPHQCPHPFLIYYKTFYTSGMLKTWKINWDPKLHIVSLSDVTSSSLSSAIFQGTFFFFILIWFSAALRLYENQVEYERGGGQWRAMITVTTMNSHWPIYGEEMSKWIQSGRWNPEASLKPGEEANLSSKWVKNHIRDRKVGEKPSHSG